MYGKIGPQAVSGWDAAPRWTVTWLEGRLTLHPSLGCPGMRDKSCTGHWWVREGRLVPA